MSVLADILALKGSRAQLCITEGAECKSTSFYMIRDPENVADFIKSGTQCKMLIRQVC